MGSRRAADEGLRGLAAAASGDPHGSGEPRSTLVGVGGALASGRSGRAARPRDAPSASSPHTRRQSVTIPMTVKRRAPLDDTSEGDRSLLQRSAASGDRTGPSSRKRRRAPLRRYGPRLPQPERPRTVRVNGKNKRVMFCSLARRRERERGNKINIYYL